MANVNVKSVSSASSGISSKKSKEKMNNVTEIIRVINIKVTQSEKEYYQGIAKANNISVTRMIKFAMEQTFPKIRN